MNTLIQKKLPPEFKFKLTAALRSGKYKRGSGRLYNPFTDSYCSLGVVAVCAGYDITDPNLASWCHLSYNEFPDNIPDVLRPSLDNNSISAKLITMNDFKKLSFNEIADWIDEFL